jgi:O-acetyl-ADP-ribose deacetylase (regulator of RNase III)/uncharacterized protein YwgA
MIKVLVGNLFESSAQTLVNTINCIGVMGKGIALEFKRRYPDMFKDYERRCKRGEVKLGRPYLFRPTLSDDRKHYQYSMFSEDMATSVSDKWVLNFPTKDHWRFVATLDDIVNGMEFLLAHYKEWGIQSLAIPPLGCGEGQLEWRIIGPTLYRYLSKMDIPVELYAPYNTLHEELQVQFLAGHESLQLQTPDPKWILPGWVALVEIIRRLEDEPYHQRLLIGKVIFQKIAYVATRGGIETQLEFQKGSYGPYSSVLQKNVLSRLVNNGLIQHEYLGKIHSIKPGPTFADARKAYLKNLRNWDQIIGKVVDLFMRLNTEQSEIIATIMFATDQLEFVNNQTPSEQDVFDYVMKWKELKKPPLSPQKVADAIRNLAILDWIEVKPSKCIPLSVEEKAYHF